MFLDLSVPWVAVVLFIFELQLEAQLKHRYVEVSSTMMFPSRRIGCSISSGLSM